MVVAESELSYILMQIKNTRWLEEQNWQETDMKEFKWISRVKRTKEREQVQRNIKIKTNMGYPFPCYFRVLVILQKIGMKPEIPKSHAHFV